VSKRLIVCCDGTWSKQDQAHATNLPKVHAAVDLGDGPDLPQRAEYFPGVGTKWGEVLRGGAFGWGLSRAVLEAYAWTARNYEPEDEIFLFGFSRGAYTARSIAGLIRNCGLLEEPTRSRLDEAYTIYRSAEPPDGPRASAFRAEHSHPLAPIRFIGVWDTVGSLGIPVGDNWVTRRINGKWGFHDTDLSGWVEHAYHALAVDEDRKPFSPTLWSAPDNPHVDQTMEQVWFSGAHSDVGGGAAGTGLSDLALLWLAERAEDAGLVFSPDTLDPGGPASVPIRPDPLSPVHNKKTGLARLIPRAPRADIGAAPQGHEALAASVVLRTEQDGTYRPANLMDAIRRGVRHAPLPRRASRTGPG
jgi:uncharacterized protein (DUF2235 family)